MRKHGVGFGNIHFRIPEKEEVQRNLHKIFFVFLLFFVVILAFLIPRIADKNEAKEAISQGRQITISQEQINRKDMDREDTIQNSEKDRENQDATEEIYSFLQGPKSWGKRLTWSGKWGKTMYDGGSFGGFGCGLCCMANIYCSLTEHKASPVDMYRYAKKQTEYGGGGAIGWGYMLQTMTQIGFQARLGNKPASYSKFQQMVEKSQSCIVLVSSAASECYWKNTPGHYVTIFLYNREKDCVFLADSGDPDHNRQWISLKKIYRSLKTESDYQYLQITAYDETRDGWKHQKAGGTWVKQKGMQ